jgi:CheY-like chemotaxis protein
LSDKKPLILYVGNDTETRELLYEVLTRANYNVFAAKTSATCLLATRSGLLDLFILDVQLFEGSGIELCKQIRIVDKKTPILFYAAYARTRLIEEAMKVGAQAYLVQPVPTFLLLETVTRLITDSRETKLI